MQRVDLNDKKCGTCRYWEGGREIAFWNKKPFKVDCDDKGNCPAIKSPNRSPQMTCSAWAKWEKLV